MATNKVKMDSFNPVKPMVNPISQMVAEQLKKEHPERFKGKKNNAWLKVFADIETDTKLSKKDKEKKIVDTKRQKSKERLAKARLGAKH